MSIEQEMAARLTDSLKAGRSKELALLRMIKARATEEQKKPGFSAETDDAFWLGIIQRYVGQQAKAMIEFEKAGEKGAEHVTQLRYEIDYFEPFMPKVMDEAATKELVLGAIRDTGADSVKMMGKVIGHIMKNHKDEVDAALVKKIATQQLR